jgi:poly(A) polymerase/tRNA nucleotidyltransferase (CCA-adding enzyme)
MNIPQEIIQIINTLQQNDYQAYVVGGCVRDLALGQEPKDWDITTNAQPDSINSLFPRSFYENDFGTVSIITDSSNPALKTIEITPFRIEGKYSDKRHPDNIQFAETLEEDLGRRDFTINAMALATENQKSKVKSQNYNSKFKIIDLFGGQEDLHNKIIRAVGNPEERFNEDALRMMRAIRFATTLGQEMWKIEKNTSQAIRQNSQLLRYISQERIRDELIKIIMSPNGANGLELLQKLGLLRYILPELEEGIALDQGKHHIYSIYNHNILSLDYACKQKFSLEVRLASLLHDIAKPRVRKKEGKEITFYTHEIVGAKMAKLILQRLRFSGKQVEKITKLVRFHLFYYNVDEVGEASVRRLLKNVGPENIEELLQIRKADRIGSGVAKAEPYKLRHLKYVLDKVAQDPISAKMLKINGADIMQLLGIRPGPKIGQILSYLLSQVLSDPSKNTRDFLETQVKQLGGLSEIDLQKLAQKAKKEVEQVETKKDQMTKQKYWVT